MKKIIIEKITLEDFKALLTEVVMLVAQEKSDEFLNVQEASRYTKIPVTTIYEYTSAKKIPFHKKGKKLFFIKQELSDWLTNKQNDKEVKDDVV